MSFTLTQLPYSKDALAPHISAETLDFHHGKHHAKYVDTLNSLVEGTPWKGRTLEEIVRKAEPGALFNNAAQHWNHDFYWHCLSPKGGGAPAGELAKKIEAAFGGIDDFRKEFGDAAKSQFGSGWAWLVKTSEGGVEICTTPNAENPLQRDLVPLLTCDVWEHAYYVDYRNDRGAYLEAFWKLVNWDFAAERLGG